MTGSYHFVGTVRNRVEPTWLSVNAPSMARFYDAMLGGKDNYLADRELVARVTAIDPAMPRLFRQNRRFLAQSVRRMADRGVTQFLDLGCGLPTGLNTHQIARRRASRARVVYVDRDPMVLAHGHALLVDDDLTGMVGADVRDPLAVLDADETRRLIDPSQPVGVLLTSVLPHVPDEDDPHGLVRSYMERLPSGSMLALSHFHASDVADPRRVRVRDVERVMVAGLGSGWFRSRTRIAAFFDGLHLEEPGLRALPLWGPDRCIGGWLRPVLAPALCGLARKP
ncbi:SAM-dependent methyltransferase [Thermomonospora amylolytica]|uniref:SAM-dependent methyltransferase n=1 Tax=Thermomonospora amylolytica TaxID=1411117 RepID=UPI0013008144|nr:SAM-dependent methyltransferase [Thermomonospora amylolytica]